MILRILSIAVLQFCVITYAFGAGAAPQITKLNVQCDRTGMKVNVEFDNPFNGIIFSKGHYSDPNCRWIKQSSSRRMFNFYIGLSGCGTITTDMAVGQTSAGFKNVIIIQNDPDYQDITDSARKLSCDWVTRLEKFITFAPFGVDMLGVKELRFPGDTVDCWMDIQRGHGPFSNTVGGVVPIGEKLTVVIYVRDTDSSFDVHVKDCYAYDKADYKSSDARAIRLTDERGCSIKNKLVQGFYRTRDVRNSGATIIAYGLLNAFKFPERMDVFLACNVEVCKGSCPDQECQPEVAVAGDANDSGSGTCEGCSTTEAVTTEGQTTEDSEDGEGGEPRKDSEDEDKVEGREEKTDEKESKDETETKEGEEKTDDKETTDEKEEKDEDKKDEKDEDKKEETDEKEEKDEKDEDKKEEKDEKEEKTDTEAKEEGEKKEEKDDKSEDSDSKSDESDSKSSESDSKSDESDSKSDESDSKSTEDEKKPETTEKKSESNKKDSDEEDEKDDDVDDEKIEQKKRSAKLQLARRNKAKSSASLPSPARRVKATKKTARQVVKTAKKVSKSAKSVGQKAKKNSKKVAKIVAKRTSSVTSKPTKKVRRVARTPITVQARFGGSGMYQREGRHIRSRRSVIVTNDNATFPAMMHSISIISPVEDLDEKELKAWERMIDLEGKVEEMSIFDAISKMPNLSGDSYCFTKISLLTSSILLSALIMVVSVALSMVFIHLQNRSKKVLEVVF